MANTPAEVGVFASPIKYILRIMLDYAAHVWHGNETATVRHKMKLNVVGAIVGG